MADEKETADAMLTAVAEFIKSQGWNVVVVGDARIQKPPGERGYNYEFVVRFTGAKQQTETPKSDEGNDNERRAQ